MPAADIWSVSTEKDELERCYRDGNKHILLGGSDYTLEPWLITPFLLDASSTSEQINFNEKHAQVQRRILKGLSIFQDKFEVLQSSRYPAEKMTKIINACCAVYNIASENGCFNDLIDGNDIDPVSKGSIEQSLNVQIDGPDRNPYYNIGSQIRDEMMLCSYVWIEIKLELSGRRLFFSKARADRVLLSPIYSNLIGRALLASGKSVG